MPARTVSLLGTLLVIAPALASAQAPPPAPVRTTTESTRTVETTADDDEFEHLGWELAQGDEGVRVERIITDSPIAAARLEENDVIKSIGGENVLTPERVREVLRTVAETGESTTEIVVIRDGKELSYLLPLDSLTTVGSATTRKTTRVTQSNLVEIIQQLQIESQQQRMLLQTLLTEVQGLRAQLAGAPNASVNSTTVVPGGPQYTGDIVAPLGGVAAPGAAGTAAPQQPATRSQANPNRR